jgi:hypothetical protein
MMAEQARTVGLAKGGQPYQSTGVSNTPVEPTLASRGIDKNLAKRARLRREFMPTGGTCKLKLDCSFWELVRASSCWR